LLDLGALDRLLTDRVRLLSVVHISNSMGTVNPVAELCRRARQVGAVTLVDAAQSAGHCVVDVQSIGCDFLVFSGHKICGPTGVGVLHGRRELLEAPAAVSGGGEMILSVDFQQTTFKPAPHRFEAGTPDISGPIGLHAAMDYLDAIGRDTFSGTTRNWRSTRTKGWRDARDPVVRAQAGTGGAGEFSVGGRACARRGDGGGSIWGRAARGASLHATVDAQARVESTARASFYFYNTRAEVDRFLEVR
jgi:cysteine desulfurase / selenocysteine lyase